MKRTRVIKPRGHAQESPSKDQVLAVLSAVTMASTRDIAEQVKLSTRCTRQHLYDLQKTGEVARIDEPLRSLAWCLPDRAEQARSAVLKGQRTKHIPREHVSSTRAERLDQQFDTPVVQIVRPIGHWRVDHAVAPRSVFELGVA